MTGPDQPTDGRFEGAQHRFAVRNDALPAVGRIAAASPAQVVIHQAVRCGARIRSEAAVVAAPVAPGGRRRRQPAARLGIYRTLVAKGADR